MDHNVITTEESHSELGAAQELLVNVWEQLRADRIQLPFGSTTGTASVTRNQGWRTYLSGKLTKLWTNFLQHPVDIVTSILMSVVLVGLFVAESSGSIASARIVSDTTAKIHSSKCSILPFRGVKYPIYDPPIFQASRYAQKCYDAPLGSEGCNDFYNQSIGFMERSNDTCPFSGNVCAQGRYSALTFDTGYVHANTIGLNVAQNFNFRRSTTCAPLVPDYQEIRIYRSFLLNYPIQNTATTQYFQRSITRQAKIPSRGRVCVVTSPWFPWLTLNTTHPPVTAKTPGARARYPPHPG